MYFVIIVVIHIADTSIIYHTCKIVLSRKLCNYIPLLEGLAGFIVTLQRRVPSCPPDTVSRLRKRNSGRVAFFWKTFIREFCLD